MDLKQIFDSAQENFNRKADVKFVFGNLIEAEGKSIIPVSVIKYQIGGGEGKGPDISKINGVAKDDADDDGKENRPGGKGVGGRFSNQPLGLFEITEDSTRFIPVIPVKAIIVAIFIWLVTRALKKKHKAIKK